MDSILAALLILAFLIGIFAVMFRGVGGRTGRPPSGILTRFNDPQGSALAAAPLAAYALASFLATINPAASRTSIILGILLAILVSIPGVKNLTVAACNVVATLLACVAAFLFVRGDGDFEELSSLYRLGLMVIVLLSFSLGALIGSRDSAIAGSRGYVLFGLVEISVFLAAPSGRDTIGLGQVGNAVFMMLIAGVGFALGWAVSEYMIGVAAIAVAIVVALQTTRDPQTVAGLLAGCTALGAVLAFRTASGIFHRK